MMNIVSDDGSQREASPMKKLKIAYEPIRKNPKQMSIIREDQTALTGQINLENDSQNQRLTND